MYKRDIGKKIPKIKYNKLKKLLLQKTRLCIGH